MVDAQAQVHLETLYRTYASRVFKYARRRGAAVPDADDIVSDTYLVCWRRLPEVPEPAALPWLLAIARRVLAEQNRASLRRQALLGRLADSGGQAAEESESAAATAQALLFAVSRLPEKDRETLLLVCLDGLSATEAALVLDCSPEAVRARVSRVRRVLRAWAG